MESESNQNMILVENFQDETVRAVIHLRNMLNSRLEDIANVLDKRSK